MGGYLVRRLLWAVWLFFVATLIVYVIFFLIPSDPAHLATSSGVPGAAVFVQRIRSELHLDVPFYQQYWIFLWNMVRHGSLGYSFTNGASVRWIIGQDGRVTGSLVLGGVVLWLAIAIPVGVVSALRPRSFFDRGSMLFVLFGISAPPVWLGLMLAYTFGFRLGWTPIADYCNFLPSSLGECGGPVHWADHLILPWLTIAFLFAALYARLIRATVLETAGEDYVRTARAKGASGRRVLVHHVLRNSMLPLVTMLGMDMGVTLGWAVFVERVFNLHGLGAEMVDSVHTGDVPVVVGIVIFIAIVVIVLNFAVDLAYGWLDPRIRLRTSARGFG